MTPMCVPGAAAAAAATVPRPAEPPLTLTSKVAKGANPLGWKFAELALRDNGKSLIDVRPRLTLGLLGFVDAEVVDATGARRSREFHWAFISSPFLKDRPAATLRARGGAVACPVRSFAGGDESDLKPGKYTCRVRFLYGHRVEPEPVEVGLAGDHLKAGRAADRSRG